MLLHISIVNLNSVRYKSYELKYEINMISFILENSLAMKFEEKDFKKKKKIVVSR